MNHGLVRLVTVALITAAAYLAVAIIPSKIKENRNTHHFFDTAVSYGSQPVTSEPTGNATQGEPSSYLAGRR
jgi:hypothetical protein